MEWDASPLSITTVYTGSTHFIILKFQDYLFVLYYNYSRLNINSINKAHNYYKLGQ